MKYVRALAVSEAPFDIWSKGVDLAEGERVVGFSDGVFAIEGDAPAETQKADEAK